MNAERGEIGDTWRESTPWWPAVPTPPVGAPNVLVIVLDDVGYGQLGCYGSDIDTPNIDRLAAEGVRLANFHTTALCSPTRSCLLTGRNHHMNGMGRVADLAVGYPGYWGRIPRENGMLGEILRANGYATFAVGKWHLTPDDETHMGASRATWPTQRGFDRWYGFHGGEAHQFVPALFQDNHAIEPPRDGDYHLSEDLAERCIRYLAEQRSVSSDQPWFAYFATGACHSPHQAPPAWIDRFRGRFDDGWDAWRTRAHARQVAMGLVPEGTELSARPDWVPAWDSLGDADQRVAARFMECFAAFLSHADAQVGRVLDFVEHELGELDNTIVVVISDNGASAEGGPKGSINDARIWNGDPAGRRELRARIDEIGTASAHNNYPWGWTAAGNTPFRRWKREVHEGGIADPCIVRYPPAIGVGEQGSIRHQFTHVIDVLPTVLDLIGVDVPVVLDHVPQTPIDGVSFAPWLTEAAASSHRQTQYFEMLGSRAIHHDGWKAVTFKPLGAMYDDGLDPDAPFDDDVWELYHVAEDFSECHDLARERPDKLAELIEIWWREARRFQVLPLDNRPLAALLAPRHQFVERDRYVFWPGSAIIAENITANTRNRTHRIRADFDLQGRALPDGVIIALGTVLGGWSLHVLHGRVRYSYNRYGAALTEIVADVSIAAAEQIECRFASNGDFTGTIELVVDGQVVGGGELGRTTPVRHSIIGSGLTCGWEQGPPVGTGYGAPFRMPYGLARVTIEVEGVAEVNPVADFARIMSEQ